MMLVSQNTQSIANKPWGKAENTSPLPLPSACYLYYSVSKKGKKPLQGQHILIAYFMDNL